LLKLPRVPDDLENAPNLASSASWVAVHVIVRWYRMLAEITPQRLG